MNTIKVQLTKGSVGPYTIRYNGITNTIARLSDNITATNLTLKQLLGGVNVKLQPTTNKLFIINDRTKAHSEVTTPSFSCNFIASITEDASTTSNEYLIFEWEWFTIPEEITIKPNTPNSYKNTNIYLDSLDPIITLDIPEISNIDQNSRSIGTKILSEKINSNNLYTDMLVYTNQVLPSYKTKYTSNDILLQSSNKLGPYKTKSLCKNLSTKQPERTYYVQLINISNIVNKFNRTKLSFKLKISTKVEQATGLLNEKLTKGIPVRLSVYRVIGGNYNIPTANYTEVYTANNWTTPDLWTTRCDSNKITTTNPRVLIGYYDYTVGFDKLVKSTPKGKFSSYVGTNLGTYVFDTETAIGAFI